MFRHHLITFLRNLKKHKIFSAITIGGLSLAMAGAILLFLFVDHELSYDNFHKGADRIYNVLTIEKNDSGNKNVARSMPQFAPALRTVTGVEAACKFFASWDKNFTYNSEKYSSDKIFYADSGFSDVFSFEVLSGDLKKTLSGVSSIAIAGSLSRKLFSLENPIGKQIIFNDQPFLVETVFEDVPSNSHISFEILVPIGAIAWLDEQISNEAYTYFMIDKKSNAENTLSNAKKVCAGLLKMREKKTGYVASVGFRRLLDIHLFGEETFYELPGQGKMTTVYVLAALAFFIILIAVLNFINIFTARSQERIKEIGLRKTVGGSKTSLMLQFLLEAIFISLFAVALGAVLALLLLEHFSLLVNRDITITMTEILRLFFACIIIAVSVGGLAGFYPAFYVSRFSPSNILARKINFGKKNKLMTATVLVQFSIVIVMLSLVMILFLQINFMKNKDLGFNKQQVIVFDYNDYKSYEALRSKLLENPHIKNVTASESVPGQITSGQIAIVEGSLKENVIPISECRVQDHFIETYEMKIVRGRDFDENLETDKENIIINEAAVKQLGLSLDKSVGARIDYGRGAKTVIGVVKDYNFSSLHKNIEPLVLTHFSKYSGFASARLKTTDVGNTIRFIKQTAAKFDPQLPFTYFFIDESFEQMYKKEEAENTLLQYSTLIVIFLAMLGLVSLTSIITNKRTKEIGIRKVLGANISGLVALISGSILKYVVLANLLACPAAWYAGNLWLENFAYRITISPMLFLTSGFLALILAFGSIGVLTLKAAVANPVEALRYE